MPPNRTKTRRSAQALLVENQIIARVQKCSEREEVFGKLAHFTYLLND